MVEVLMYCLTAIIITCIVCYTFAPKDIEPQVIEVPIENKVNNTQEDEDAENALVTALGEINNLFGGVEDED